MKYISLLSNQYDNYNLDGNVNNNEYIMIGKQDGFLIFGDQGYSYSKAGINMENSYRYWYNIIGKFCYNCNF